MENWAKFLFPFDFFLFVFSSNYGKQINKNSEALAIYFD